MTIRPIRYPRASWSIQKSPVYAVAGRLMTVSALVSVATMEKQIAHHGTPRPARK